jgi:hypothetical protein
MFKPIMHTTNPNGFPKTRLNRSKCLHVTSSNVKPFENSGALSSLPWNQSGANFVTFPSILSSPSLSLPPPPTALLLSLLSLSNCGKFPHPECTTTVWNWWLHIHSEAALLTTGTTVLEEERRVVIYQCDSLRGLWNHNLCIGALCG